MRRSGGSSSNLVPLSVSSCQWVYNQLPMSAAYSSGCCESVCFVSCVPADPEGCGFLALRGHRHHIPAASGGDLGPSFSFQFEPFGCHGTGARGAAHRLVQSLCPSPLLRQNWNQLRGHAHELDTHQGKTLQGIFLSLVSLTKVCSLRNLVST